MVTSNRIYDVDPANYGGVETIEQMLEIDRVNIAEDPLLFFDNEECKLSIERVIE